MADVGAFTAHIGAADDVKVEFGTHFLLGSQWESGMKCRAHPDDQDRFASQIKESSQKVALTVSLGTRLEAEK